MGSPCTGAVWARKRAEAAGPGIAVERGSGLFPTGAVCDRHRLGVRRLKHRPFQPLTRLGEVGGGRQESPSEPLIEMAHGRCDEIGLRVKVLIARALRDAAGRRDVVHAKRAASLADEHVGGLCDDLGVTLRSHVLEEPAMRALSGVFGYRQESGFLKVDY